MALDALAIKCLTNEISALAYGARIDKISQPEKDEIVLGIRTRTDNYKLVLSASSAHPRAHFTDRAKRNPKTAPMFCMLLRKHLSGGKIIGVAQPDLERVINSSVESYDELGNLTVKHLIAEIMGRHSNIILTNSDMKIIDCIKHVDFNVSSVRRLLPGLEYTPAPKQNKIPIIEFSNESQIDFSVPKQADKVIMDTVSGISPIIARELVYDAFASTDVIAASLNTNQAAALKTRLVRLAEHVRDDKFTPCLIEEAASGKYLDFSAIPIQQYGAFAKVTEYDTMSRLVDTFFYTRDMRERMRQKSADMTRLIGNLIERTAKKIGILNKTLAGANDGEKYKIKGDLITANIYKIEPKSTELTAENYYVDGTPSIKIALDPSLTPSQNAQKYYKKYTKSKTALIEAAKQLEFAQTELKYLESTLSLIENAESESDLNAIRAELADEGYLNGARSRKKREVSKPRHFISSEGFDIYVGKNNSQNDYLTLKFANSSDMWFHTKEIHGSHVIIKLAQNKDIPDSAIKEAAQLAAYYSKARGSSQVPVDYTRVKNVKKPNGAKPGMVIYNTYNTLYVTPKIACEKSEE
ncbi:MAG: NFACT family protein [Firmicutes bacterium]|nr:NFACT family protein [Bacillota bacterium]